MHLRGSRRRTQWLRRVEGESGVAGVIFVILLGGGLILGMSAMVVDLGQIYVERRILQNAADASALAIAQRCAMAQESSSYATKCTRDVATANLTQMANGNSADQQTDISSICGFAYPGSALNPSVATYCPPVSTKTYDCKINFRPNTTTTTPVQQYVRVITSTKTSTGTTLKLFFAKAFLGSTSSDTVTVKACGQAFWGGVSKADVKLPFALSICNFVGIGANTITGNDGANSTACTNRSSLSGTTLCNSLTDCNHVGTVGFACTGSAVRIATATGTENVTTCAPWNDANCLMTHPLQLGDYIEYQNSGASANGVEKLCGGNKGSMEAAMTANLGQTFAVPVYSNQYANSLTSNSVNSVMKIVAFARFTFDGFSMSGASSWKWKNLATQNSYTQNGTVSPTNCPNICVAGSFSEVLNTGGELDTNGSVPNLGIQVLRLAS